MEMGSFGGNSLSKSISRTVGRVEMGERACFRVKKRGQAKHTRVSSGAEAKMEKDCIYYIFFARCFFCVGVRFFFKRKH